MYRNSKQLNIFRMSNGKSRRRRKKNHHVRLAIQNYVINWRVEVGSRGKPKRRTTKNGKSYPIQVGIIWCTCTTYSTLISFSFGFHGVRTCFLNNVRCGRFSSEQLPFIWGKTNKRGPFLYFLNAFFGECFEGNYTFCFSWFIKIPHCHFSHRVVLCRLTSHSVDSTPICLFSIRFSIEELIC